MIPDAIQEAVNEAKRNAPAFPSDAWPNTVLDVLGTPPQSASGFCVRGYTFAKLHSATHNASVAYRRCSGGSCPACIGFYLSDTIARVWQYKFNGAETLYRYTTTHEQFRAKRNRVKGHWWVRQADGTLDVFTTDPYPDAVEVPAIPALLQSLLSAPAVVRKKAQGQKAENRHSPAPAHPKPEADPEVNFWRVPKGIFPQDTLQRFSERLIEAGLPVPVWSKKPGLFTYATAVKYMSALTPTQAEVFRVVYGDYHEQAVEEFLDMVHTARERRRAREYREAHPLPPNATVLEMIASAYVPERVAAAASEADTAVMTAPPKTVSAPPETVPTEDERLCDLYGCTLEELRDMQAPTKDEWYCEEYGCTLEELRDMQAMEGWADGRRPSRSVTSEEYERNQAKRKRHERYLKQLRTRAFDLAMRETSDDAAFSARLHELYTELDRLDSLGLIEEPGQQAAPKERALPQYVRDELDRLGLIEEPEERPAG